MIFMTAHVQGELSSEATALSKSLSRWVPVFSDLNSIFDTSSGNTERHWLSDTLS